MLHDTARDLFRNLTGDREGLTNALRGITDKFRRLVTEDPESEELDSFVAEVGNAAREQPNRLPLGDSGLLSFVCTMVMRVDGGLRSAVLVHCLRMIGNCSADEDENRKRVVESGCVQSIVPMVRDDALFNYAVSVLLNLCVDFEPAHEVVYKARINPELVGVLTRRGDSVGGLIGLVYKLLGFVATQEPEEGLIDPATAWVLLHMANSQPEPVDAEDFLAAISTALMYLSRESDQQAFLNNDDAVGVAIEVYYKLCTADLDAEEEEEAERKQMETTYMSTLADLSAQPSFASLLSGDQARRLQDWIRQRAHPGLRSAACLMLGNIARSDDACKTLVHGDSIHEPLAAALRETDATAVHLHCVLSFLRNLAIPRENKPVLGAAGLFEADALPRIWRHMDTQPQVQFAAVSLARLLLVGCAANVHRICTICTPLPEPEPEDETLTTTTPTTTTTTPLQILLDLNARSDNEPIQMETARAAALVCRTLHTPTPTEIPSSNSNPNSESFYTTHPTIAAAMARLVTQTKYPLVAADAFLSFSLMARSSSAVAVGLQALSHKREFVDAVVRWVSGDKGEEKKEEEKEEGEQKQTQPKEVRANALVFIATLLDACEQSQNEKQGGEEGEGEGEGEGRLPSDIRLTFEKLLRESVGTRDGC
ncbi:armadillo-type protein [Xylariaceae sp. FL0594]|nr:armadillo-type protein [Xylariaceae sp. FL0594]